MLRFERTEKLNEFLSKLITGRDVSEDAEFELREIARRAEVMLDA